MLQNCAVFSNKQVGEQTGYSKNEKCLSKCMTANGGLKWLISPILYEKEKRNRTEHDILKRGE